MQNIILRKAILTTTIAALLLGATAGHRLHAAEPQPAFRMACIFTDHMVLQRDQPLPVWGWAAPGRAVTVEVGPHSARTRTNAEGRWRLTLPPLESGKGPLTMTVKAGDETIRLTDILVGEVWLCSGQSNMEMTVYQSADGKAEIKAANHPNIRLFNIPRPTAMASDPQDDVVGQWQACSPETIGDFSAVGYYFGREIHQSIEVPVGLINASWGGTIIETWTRHEEISRLPGMTERIAEAQDIHHDPTVVPKDMTAEEKRAAKIHQAACKAKADYKLAFKASEERAAKSRQAFNEAKANDELARKMTSPDLDLRSWKTMEIPSQWGEAGLPDFRGMVWFRKTIDVPESWAGKNLVLHLDRILEGDVTWFNGERVGATAPANYHKPRVYSIPANLVKAGANTITVRVIDTYRSRGLSGKPDALALCVAGSEETDRIGLAGPWRYKPGVQLHASLPYPDDQVNHPTLLYNTMIHPLVPFAIRGITWYQGEQNNGDGMLYFDKMQALIQSWRNVFLRPDAPFYFVQIAPFRYGGGMEHALPELWEAQSVALDIPHTGMAVISDIGHVNWLHPSNKQGVGKRLALWALAKDYGQEDLVHSGPLYKSLAIEGSKIRLSFDHTGSGLASRDAKPLDRFEIAGEDGKFVKAQAVIDGHTVLISSDAIAKPTAARFAWDQVAVPNLINKEGLPAGPFRTDSARTRANAAADESADLQKRFSTWINERVELKKEQHGFHRGAHEEKLAEKRGMNIPKTKYSSEELTFDDAFVPPEDPDLWPLWRDWLAQWRKDKREALAYDDSYYGGRAYDWIPSNYVSGFLMLWDMDLLDSEEGKYKVEEFIENGKKEFGGYDSVVLWLAYPILGINERNQTDMYRNMPGGLEGMRDLVETFHKHGIKVFMPFQPWDSATRQEDKTDAEVLIATTEAINADGIYLDTWYECAPLRLELDKIRPGLAIDTELPVPIEYVAEHQMSWAQMKPWRTWMFDEGPAPGVMKSKWLERRHVVRPTNRWIPERTGELQASWMNGTGTLIWENRFGCWNGWDERARSILRSMIPVQRRYVDLFTGEGWTPLVEHRGEDVFASLWEGDGLKLWTLVNRADEAYSGNLLAVRHRQGTRYFDLIQGKQADIDLKDGVVRIDGEIDARGIGGILAIPEEGVTSDFRQFLKGQTKLYANRNWDPTFPALKKRLLNPGSKTKEYGEDDLPPEMAAISAASVTLKRSFNEGAFPKGFHDTLTEEVEAELSAYAIDVTPVTNADYAEFLKASGYKPPQKMNFLKHWVDGKPPVGKEDHPVVYVDLNDARAYAKWAGKRLPTDSEWHYAAAGPDSLEYPWGNRMESDRCNKGEDGTTCVKAFPEGRSPFGCYDMCGNTWEWTESEQTDDGRSRYSLIRGGSWFNTVGSDWYVDGESQPCNRVTKMLLVWPGLDRCSTIGFRCVADLAEADGAENGSPLLLERDRYLLLDSRVVANTDNAKLTLGRVKKHPGNPLFEEDKPWEKRFDNLYANVIYDAQDKLYKCWYSPFVIDDSAKGMTLAQREEVAYDPPDEREMAICYATSKDGISWMKPELGLVEYEGTKATNILWRGVGENGDGWEGPHGTGIFKDLRDPNPKRRYKAFLKADNLSVAFSSDGIHWDPAIACPEADSAGDTHNNAFWAPTLGQYVGITREWGEPFGRQVARTSSTDFVNWRKCEIVLEGLDAEHQTYAMPVFYYGGVYLGLVAIFNTETDRTSTELTWSPDTVTWHRVLPGTPLIPNSEKEGAYDWGCVYAAAYPVFVKDEIRLYYGGSDGYHGSWRNGFFCLATLRPDGFAGYTQAEAGKPTTITTTPVDDRSKGTLRLSADVGRKGYVKLSVLGERDEVLAESESLNGSVSDGEVTWRDEFSFDTLGKKSARIRFEFQNATIYSFSFVE